MLSRHTCHSYYKTRNIFINLCSHSFSMEKKTLQFKIHLFVSPSSTDFPRYEIVMRIKRSDFWNFEIPFHKFTTDIKKLKILQQLRLFSNKYKNENHRKLKRKPNQNKSLQSSNECAISIVIIVTRIMHMIWIFSGGWRIRTIITITLMTTNQNSSWNVMTEMATEMRIGYALTETLDFCFLF